MKLKYSDKRKARYGRFIVVNLDGTLDFISPKTGNKLQRWKKRL